MERTGLRPFGKFRLRLVVATFLQFGLALVLLPKGHCGTSDSELKNNHQAEDRFPIPPAESLGGQFLFHPNENDWTFSYSPSDRYSIAFRALRIDWRPSDVELHYGFITLNTLLYRLENPHTQFSLYLTPGLGLANKLTAINRLAYHLGGESTLESRTYYGNLKFTGLAAPDFDLKSILRFRVGFYPFRDPILGWTALLLAQATYESKRAYEMEWGPVLRLQRNNLYLETFGNFKGTLAMSLGFFY